MTDISALSADAAWWSGADRWALLVVTIGVIVEGIAEWLPKERREARTIVALTRTGWLVLVLALAGEYIAQHNKDADDAEITAILQRENLALQNRVSNAQKEAANARAHAGQVDINLLSEQRLTARERLRLEQLERSVLPRSAFLDAAALVQALKEGNFPPVNLAVAHFAEPQDLAFTLTLVLAEAKLTGRRIDLPHEIDDLRGLRVYSIDQSLKGVNSSTASSARPR